MQLNYFLYVKRDWREDQLGLCQFVHYYSRMRYPSRIVLFPEGTDLSDDNRRKSDKFAAANNLPVINTFLGFDIIELYFAYNKGLGARC